MVAATPEPEKKAETPAAADTTGAPAATPAPAPPAESMAAAPPELEKKSEAPAAPAAETRATPPAATPLVPVAPETKPADSQPTVAAAPATPEDIKDRTSPPDPVSELAKSEGFQFSDGRYRTKDGDPQFVVTKDYMVDWGTWNGFRRYHDACHVCHGPNALGSTFAPALADSLKTMDYNTFVATVSGGRTVNRAGTTYVMPAFGEDRNIMCYLDDIYTYIKSRSTGAMPPGRPNGREDISPEARQAANDCTG
jgi:methanol metabolism-related c-type cytochrome